MSEEELLLSVTCPNMSHDQHVVFITPSISIGAEYVSTIDMLINTNGSAQNTTADKIIEMIMGK